MRKNQEIQGRWCQLCRLHTKHRKIFTEKKEDKLVHLWKCNNCGRIHRQG